MTRVINSMVPVSMFATMMAATARRAAPSKAPIVESPLADPIPTLSEEKTVAEGGTVANPADALKTAEKPPEGTQANTGTVNYAIQSKSLDEVVKLLRKTGTELFKSVRKAEGGQLGTLVFCSAEICAFTAEDFPKKNNGKAWAFDEKAVRKSIMETAFANLVKTDSEEGASAEQMREAEKYPYLGQLITSAVRGGWLVFHGHAAIKEIDGAMRICQPSNVIRPHILSKDNVDVTNPDTHLLPLSRVYIDAQYLSRFDPTNNSLDQFGKLVAKRDTGNSTPGETTLNKAPIKDLADYTSLAIEQELKNPKGRGLLPEKLGKLFSSITEAMGTQLSVFVTMVNNVVQKIPDTARNLSETDFEKHYGCSKALLRDTRDNLDALFGDEPDRSLLGSIEGIKLYLPDMNLLTQPEEVKDAIAQLHGALGAILNPAAAKKAAAGK